MLSVNSLKELMLFSFCNFSTNKLRKNERNHCQILASAYCAFMLVHVLSALVG
jgi:type IV secretory pathway component VirB8